LFELIAKKPLAIFIVSGDFNTAEKPIKFLHELSLTEYTYRREILGETRQSYTDWVLCS
jgi:hypothetical protein